MGIRGTSMNFLITFKRSRVHANTVTAMKGYSVLAHVLSTKDMKWILLIVTTPIAKGVGGG
jgi:hypothetical protein